MLEITNTLFLKRAQMRFSANANPYVSLLECKKHRTDSLPSLIPRRFKLKLRLPRPNKSSKRRQPMQARRLSSKRTQLARPLTTRSSRAFNLAHRLLADVAVEAVEAVVVSAVKTVTARAVVAVVKAAVAVSAVVVAVSAVVMAKAVAVVANVVVMAKAVETVAEAAPEPPEEREPMAKLKSTELSRAVGPEETNSKARHVKMLTPWTDKTELAEAVVATAKTVTAEADGVVQAPRALT